jgi:GNAT superfamily N-acetyltransferase
MRPETMSTDGVITVLPADERDVPTLLSFIKGLAEYERLSDTVVATEQALRQTLFGDRPSAHVLIARYQGRPAGFALFFPNYSTFLARPGMYLEDLFVLPEMRGRGIGSALLSAVARAALDRGCGRMEWSVLDWNEPAIAFYKRVGATVMPDWRICRVTGEGIERLAAVGPSARPEGKPA